MYIRQKSPNWGRLFYGQYYMHYTECLQNQNALDDYYLLEYARKLGINAAEFETDFGKDRFYQKVKDDYDSGLENKVEGTPTFFVNGEAFDGNWMTSEFIEYLESLISE